MTITRAHVGAARLRAVLPEEWDERFAPFRRFSATRKVPAGACVDFLRAPPHTENRCRDLKNPIGTRICFCRGIGIFRAPAPAHRLMVQGLPGQVAEWFKAHAWKVCNG